VKQQQLKNKSIKNRICYIFLFHFLGNLKQNKKIFYIIFLLIIKNHKNSINKLFLLIKYKLYNYNYSLFYRKKICLV
jgi:hypothetical protein